MTKNKVTDLFIVNTILFIYPFELFGDIHSEGALGAFSPFRMIIFPLCILFLLTKRKNWVKTQNTTDMLAIVAFMLMSLLAILSTNITSFFSFIGNIVQFSMAFIMVRNVPIHNSILFTITSWTLIQIPSFFGLYSHSTLGMSNRLTGMFFDPNYLCAFVLSAMWSAYFLLYRTHNKMMKCYCLSIVFFSIIMIFFSYSRGGMLALLVTIAIYLLPHRKRYLLLLVCISIPFISYALIRSTQIGWLDADSDYLDAFIYRTFVMSENIDELTAGRSGYFRVFIENMSNYIFWGTDLDYYINVFNHGAYPHNGLIELCIQGGVIIGFLFIIRLLLSVFITFKMIVKYSKTPAIFMIMLSIIIPLTFLSYSSKVAWLCLGALFSLRNKDVFNFQIR